MKNKKINKIENSITLPSILIKGIGKTIEEKIDSILLIEIILILLGFDSKEEEKWNNHYFEEILYHNSDIFLQTFGFDKSMCYFGMDDGAFASIFDSDKINEIIYFVEQYKNKNK